MSKKHSLLDFKLPAEIIEIGRAIAAVHFGSRSPLRQNIEASTPEQAHAVTARVTKLIRENPAARALVGIGARGGNDPDSVVRVRAFALLAYRSLAQPAVQAVCEIADLASAAMDSTEPPGVALLHAREIVGRMAAEDLLIAVECGEGGPCSKVILPARALDWLTGGKNSFGFLTAAKLERFLAPHGIDTEAAPAKPRPIPNPMELAALIRKDVVGLDAQVSALSSQLVLHLARAKLLASGRESGTGNSALLLVGSSSCGKTWLMESAARAAACPFASLSATAMTSEGYVGGKIDDLFRAVVMRAKGDVAAARFGIAFTDEFDKKASRQGRDVTTVAIQQEFLVPMGGAEFLIAGKRGMERSVTFNSKGTFFVFAGAFSGLADLIRKKTAQSCIGFASGGTSRRQEYILDAVREYGFIREWVNRLTAVMFLPDPTRESLEMAAGSGVLDGFNILLNELGVILLPHEDSIQRMAAYALESRTFYRGLKTVWWSIAEAAVAGGEKGVVPVGAAEVELAIGRVASGSAGGIGNEVHPRQESICANPSVAYSASESANC